MHEVIHPSPPNIVVEDLPIFPLEDVQSYGDLIRDMAAHLDIPASQLAPPVNDIVFDVVQAQLSSAITIPLMKVMLQLAKSTWNNLASMPISSKSLDCMYWTVSRSLCCLALMLWDVCIKHNITPFATHLSGEQNTIVDVLSQDCLLLHEHHLSPSVLTPVFHCWGLPQIDVFAQCGYYHPISISLHFVEAAGY